MTEEDAKLSDDEGPVSDDERSGAILEAQTQYALEDACLRRRPDLSQTWPLCALPHR